MPRKEPDEAEAAGRCWKVPSGCSWTRCRSFPIYYYVSRNMVRPHVRGFYNNLQDMHPLHAIWIDPNVNDKAPRPNEYMEPVQVIWFIVRRLIGLIVHAVDACSRFRSC